MTTATEIDVVAALRRVVDGEVDDSTRRRAEYSTDASNYRVPPRVVVAPRDADDALAALDVARRLGVPVTARGGGTSVAGNAVGTGVVLDFSRHMNQIVEPRPGGAHRRRPARCGDVDAAGGGRARTGCASGPTPPPRTGPRWAG